MEKHLPCMPTVRLLECAPDHSLPTRTSRPVLAQGGKGMVVVVGQSKEGDTGLGPKPGGEEQVDDPREKGI